MHFFLVFLFVFTNAVFARLFLYLHFLAIRFLVCNPHAMQFMLCNSHATPSRSAIERMTEGANRTLHFMSGNRKEKIAILECIGNRKSCGENEESDNDV